MPTKNKVTYCIDAMYSTTAHWIVIAIGIVLRIAQFLYNRSLTEGEAALALNIVKRSYLDLLKPLDYFQAAPVGFLFIERCAVNVLGTNEYALRLFPLIAGIIALAFFYHLAKRILTKQAIPVALILFAVGYHLIYFSSEVKQYSSDVLFVLIILMLFLAACRSRQTLYYLIYGAAGAILLWFSHPVLFVLITGGTILLVRSIGRKEWTACALLCCGGIIAAVSFGLNYVVLLAPLSKTAVLLDTWSKSFAPFPPTSFQDLYWYGFVFARMFTFPVGLSQYELILGIASFVFGVIYIYRRDRIILIMCILPILITLFASALHLYPFEGRLLLFLTPLLVLVIAQGIAYIQSQTSTGSPLVGIALVLILLIHPVLSASYHLVKPRAPEELRPVVEYVDANYREGDVLYIYYASFNAYQYYAYRSDFEHDYVVGIEARDNWGQYYYDLSAMKGNRRVWVIMSHIETWHGTDEEMLFVSYLDMLGKQKDVLRTSGAAGYLYDLGD